MASKDGPSLKYKRKEYKRADPLLLDDTTGKLTPEGIEELERMVWILDSDSLKEYYRGIEPVAQAYLKKHHFLF